MQVPQSTQRYFQQIRPLSACDAEDGRVVGRMLKDLVESKPKDLAHAIRTFANSTAMLRESGFRHIGVMLEYLLLADAPSGAVCDTALVALDRSSATEQQAIAIGGAVASIVRRSHVPATAVRKVVNSHAVLRAMNSDFVWFVPMLEVLVAQKVAAKSRRSTLMRRMSSLVERTSVALIGGQSDGSEDDAEGGFSSVVRCP
jgi:hypothetical protein